MMKKRMKQLRTLIGLFRIVVLQGYGLAIDQSM